jgi:hypothetical protein
VEYRSNYEILAKNTIILIIYVGVGVWEQAGPVEVVEPPPPPPPPPRIGSI